MTIAEQLLTFFGNETLHPPVSMRNVWVVLGDLDFSVR